MAKYYVECGPVQMVLAAESVEHAALIAIDRALQSHRWVYEDLGLSDRDRHDHLMLEALLHLSPSVSVSERGFGRRDATSVGTPETVERWHGLMAGAFRLLATKPTDLGGANREDAPRKLAARGSIGHNEAR